MVWQVQLQYLDLVLWDDNWLQLNGDLLDRLPLGAGLVLG